MFLVLVIIIFVVQRQDQFHLEGLVLAVKIVTPLLLFAMEANVVVRKEDFALLILVVVLGLNVSRVLAMVLLFVGHAVRKEQAVALTLTAVTLTMNAIIIFVVIQAMVMVVMMVMAMVPVFLWAVLAIVRRNVMFLLNVLAVPVASMWLEEKIVLQLRLYALVLIRAEGVSVLMRACCWMAVKIALETQNVLPMSVQADSVFLG